MSTTLSIGRIPAATRRSCIHFGAGPTRRPSRGAAAYRGQAPSSSMRTSSPFGGFFGRRSGARARVRVDELASGLGDRHDRAFGEVRRGGDDDLGSYLAVVDRREPQLVGVRVLAELLDAADPDLLPPGALDTLHLGAVHVQLEREVVDRDVDVDVLAQPRDGHFDQHPSAPLPSGPLPNAAGPFAALGPRAPRVGLPA